MVVTMLQKQEKPITLDIIPSTVCAMMGVYVGFNMLVKCLSQIFGSPVPTVLISSIFCGLLGVIFFQDSIFVEDYQGLRDIPPQQILATLMPIYITSLFYQMDILIFTKTLHSYIIMVYIVLAVCFLAIFFIIHLLIHPEYDYLELTLTAFAMLPIQPVHINFMFRAFAKYKHVATILEVESVATFVPIYLLFQYATAINQGQFSVWYHNIIYLTCSTLGALIIGAILGKIITAFMSALYNERMTALPVLMGLIMFTYFLGEFLLHVSGNLIIITIASSLVWNRHTFSTQVDESILSILQLLQAGTEISVLCLYVAESVPHVLLYLSATEFYAAFFIYFLVTYMRMGVFMLLGYIIKIKKYEVDYDMHTAFVLSYSGLKGSFNLILAFIILSDPISFKLGRDLICEILVIYMFTLVANAGPMRLLLKLLGFTDLPIIRRSNMNTCMKFIVQARGTVIKNLKEFKFLTDTNWNIVRSITCLTHPYKKQVILDENIDEDEDIQEENEEIYFANTAYCPDCFREIPYDLTENEIEELCLLAQSKIIKSKKISVIRQFARGAINKNCVQVLIHNIDLLMDAKVTHSQLRVDKFIRPNRFLMFIRRLLKRQIEYKSLHPPHNTFAKFCFYLTNHVAYEYIFIFLITCYVVYIFCSSSFLEAFNLLQLLIHTTVVMLFCLDIGFKLIGIGDFLVYLDLAWSCLNLFCTTLAVIAWVGMIFSYGYVYRYLCIAYRVVTLLRLLELLTLGRRLCPFIINLVDRRLDLKITFGFDIAAALEFCCNEIIETMNQIVEIKIIRDIYAKDLKNEKMLLVNELRLVQQERPWIAITMKTKQVIRTTLKAMNNGLQELRNSGNVDSLEFEYFAQEIVAKIKFLRSIKVLRPLPARTIFSEIPWLIENKEIIEFLFSKITTVNYARGDIVMSTEMHAMGIYVVVAGVIKLVYKSKNAKLDLLQTQGAVPIVDYLSTLDFDTDFQDDITSGNTFGERSFLTRRKYDCKLIADSEVQTYLLPRDILLEAIAISHNAVYGLEAQMWKHATINLAVAILTEVPLYQSFTQQDIKFKLDRAFVPNLRCYRSFAITEDMDDVLLIDGVAKDYSTCALFKAPIMIPKNVQKLFLSQSSYVEIEKRMDTKLMIIPVPGISDVEVMMREELVADIMPYMTSNCILHNLDELLKLEPMQRRRIARGGILSKVSPTSIADTSKESSLKIIQLESFSDEIIDVLKDDTSSDIARKDGNYLQRGHYDQLSNADSGSLIDANDEQ